MSTMSQGDSILTAREAEVQPDISTMSQGGIHTDSLPLLSAKEAEALRRKIVSTESYLCQLLSRAERTVQEIIKYLDDTHGRMINVKEEPEPWEFNMMEDSIREGLNDSKIGGWHLPHFVGSGGKLNRHLAPVNTMVEIVALINKTSEIYPTVSALWGAVRVEWRRGMKFDDIVEEHWLVGVLRGVVGADVKRMVRCRDLDTVWAVERWRSEEVGRTREVRELESVLDHMEWVMEKLEADAKDAAQGLVLLETKKKGEGEVLPGEQLRRRVVAHTDA